MRLICGIIPFLLLASFAPTQTLAPKALSIEAIFAEGGITGRAPETIQWTPDNAKFSFIQRDDFGDHGQLWSVDAITGAKRVLVNEARLATLAPPIEKIKDDRERERITRYHVAAYQWAPDSRHLLFDTQGQLWMYDVQSGTAVQFSSSPDASWDPKFSPDGGRVAYLRTHNLYVQSVSGKEEKVLTRERDGDKNENLLNGEVDWVYAEELSVRSNYFWSPDGKNIVYLQMDESRVPDYPITDWLPTHPKADEEKYPKAGDPNPSVRLGVVSASGGRTKFISLTEDKDIYIPRFGWLRDGMLWAEVLNRAQDTLDLYFVDAHSGKSRKVLAESSPDSWVNVNDDFTLLKSGDRFLWSSWRDGNTHLYLYNFDKADPLAADAKLEGQITKGDFQVLGVESVDPAAGVVYFSTNKDDPRQKQLYSVKLDGSGLARVSPEDGTHEMIFAGDGKHYLDTYSAVLAPPRLLVCAPGGPSQTIWESHSVDGYGVIPPKFLEFKADDGTALEGQLLMPPQLGSNETIPLIIYIYGGPAGQVVLNEWIGDRGLFHQILAQHGFAVLSVDNRGTPNRDRKFQVSIRHEYGAIELKDQLSALDQLFTQYPQLDRNRVGIWGWSNGGSMTLYALTHSNVFKAGVSVAPVTDWHNYDSIYTERYQGLPKDNGKGYDDLFLAKVADKLHGSLFLAHGTSDDNVHFQNSIQMIEALVKAGKQFRFMAYPNKTHSISGPQDRDHLFHAIEDHFEHELK
jgi:dipeptidyl-peptidase 4